MLKLTETACEAIRSIFAGAWEGDSTRESVAAILGLADRLPPVSGAILEAKLGGGSARIDFAYRITRNEKRARTALPHALGKFASDYGNNDDNNAWSQVADFIKFWNEDKAANEEIENIWLEFDIPSRESPRIPPPAIFIDMASLADPEGGFDLRENSEPRRILKRFFQTDAHTEILISLSASLPSEVRVHYIGRMLSRPLETAHPRITFRGSVLDRLGLFFSRNDPAARTVMEIARTTTADPRLHLNLDDPAGPLGMEFRLPDDRTACKWNARKLLRVLEKYNLCTKAETRALLAWPDALRMGTSNRMYIRRLNHIKLVATHAGELHAKAYLYFCR